jgi:hypothetical protein
MITAWPIVSAGVRGGTCQGHFVLLGLTSGFTDNLDLVPAPYDWGQTYSDRWAASTVLSYAERRLPERRDIGYCSPEYDAASYSYLRQIVKTFPADIVTRSYASVLGIIKKTFHMETPLEHWATSLYSLRARVITRLTNTSLAWVCAAMFLAAAIELRLGLGLLGMVLFFGGYPAIQFSPRHDFHLEVITLFAMGFTLSCLWKCAQRPGAVTASATRRGLAFVVAAAIALSFTLLALRRVQDVRVRELFHAYLDAPKQPVPMAPAEPGALHPISFPGGQMYPAQFLQIEMHTANFGPAPAVVIRYEKRPDADLSRTIVLRREIDSHATTRVFAPVYEFFQGLEFSDEGDRCVAGVSRVSELKGFPVLVNATLSPTWEGEPLHQRIAQLWP